MPLRKPARTRSYGPTYRRERNVYYYSAAAAYRRRRGGKPKSDRMGSRQAGTRRGACPGWRRRARRSDTTTVAIIRNMKREEYTVIRSN